MMDNILKLFGFVAAICVIVICITLFITKWFDVLYRNPENADKINLIGFTASGLLEPLALAFVACIFLMVK